MDNYLSKFFYINNIFAINFSQIAKLASASRVESSFVQDNVMPVNYFQNLCIEFKDVFIVIVKWVCCRQACHSL